MKVAPQRGIGAIRSDNVEPADHDGGGVLWQRNAYPNRESDAPAPDQPIGGGCVPRCAECRCDAPQIPRSRYGLPRLDATIHLFER
jgi:hypothetical protein